MPDSPDISIALLVRNGMPTLGRLLESLRRQSDCPSFEIVAIDSGSTDGSPEALSNAGATVERIEPKQFKFGPTRQRLFGLTRGKVIVTLSQDAVPVGRWWLRKMIRPILGDSADIVISNQRAPWGLQLKLTVMQAGFAYADWPAPYSGITCSGMAIGRSAWESTGFGDVPMSEDKHLGKLAWDQKLRVTLAADALINHGHDHSAMEYVKRSFNEGMGARFTHGRYPFKQMVKDLTAVSLYKKSVSGVVRHRYMSIGDAMMLPLRPVFLWIGGRFGRGYWS